MYNATLFENTTLVRESVTAGPGETSKKKRTFDNEILFVIVFALTALVLIGVLTWMGEFDLPTEGLAAPQHKIGGKPLFLALGASAVIGAATTFLYAMKNRTPKKTQEELMKTVSYRYIINDEGITAEHGYHTDKIDYGAIDKITSNGHSYFVYTEDKRYQICINGFGSKIAAFERFLENRGFEIGIEG